MPRFIFFDIENLIYSNAIDNRIFIHHFRFERKTYTKREREQERYKRNETIHDISIIRFPQHRHETGAHGIIPLLIGYW